ncbi:MAG: hypothetical protein KDB27_05460 [Planctomycetales bacterium]|nr:hypothetical protein [Planctomycetales bacterium]
MPASEKTDSIRSLMSDERREVVADDNPTQHIRLTFSMHRLENSLGHAAPGRESQWLADVESALELLIVAMEESQEVVCRDDGLIEEIKYTAPRLLPRIDSLRDEFEGLVHQAKTLREQLHMSKQSHVAFADLRQRMDWLLSALKHHQAKEKDVIYEAMHIDIGVGD